MHDQITIRKATPEDAKILARQRLMMFEEMDHDPIERLTEMEQRFIPWVRDKIIAGEYHGWLAVDEDGVAVAGIGLWIHEWLVNPRDFSGKRAHVLNVYTDQAYRKRGVARNLMNELLALCREQGIPKITLSASRDGQHLYETLGFKPDPRWMILQLKDS
ncbi:MAG: GNAT family N-acetyltransferase [Anaerolineae bacterium]|jgi:GNAT superfamily N-acetyltransferase|nr:GNAT family N-acetyltransferase [Anaerolineae bacterium]